MKRFFLFLAFLFAAPAQASIVLVSASSQYAESNTAPVTATAFSISVWVKTDQVTAAAAVVFIGDKDATNNHWTIRYEANVANDPLRCRSRNTTGADDATIDTGGLSMNGNWRHVVCVYSSSTSRTPYISASAGTTGTTSSTPTVSDRISVGRNGDSTPDEYWSGRLAEVCIYSMALSSTDVTNLYNGGAGTPCTNVQNASLVAYYKLISDANDSKGTNHLTTGGSPTFDAADHPVTHPVASRPQVIIVE